MLADRPINKIIDLHHPSSSEIIGILDEQVEGWNNGDAQKYAKAFAADGSFTNIFGMFLTGYEEFYRKHDTILSGIFKHSEFRYKLTRLIFLDNSVALAETLVTVSGFTKSGAFNMIYTDKEGRLFTRILQVFRKEENEWKIHAYHNIDIKENIAIPEL